MPTKIKGVVLTDKISVPTQRTFTDAGQMIVPCAIARTGSMNYSAAQLQLKDRKPDEVVAVFRDEADVFDEASITSFRSAPLTIGHPKDKDGNKMNITADNAAELQVGMLEGIPARDEDLLSGTLVVTNQKAIDLIVNDEVSELSAGYTCDLEVVDEDGVIKIYQRNIRANHIAIVPKGRAGGHVRIADEEGKVSVEDSMRSVEEENIELAEAQTVMLKAKAAYDASYEVVINSATRLDEHRRAAGMYDEATVVKSDYVTAEAHEEVVAKLQVVDESIVAIKSATEDTINERVTVITKSLDATSFTMDEFEGKSNKEVKVLVLNDRLPNLNLDDKGDAYIDVRFDMVCEDDTGESEMARELRKSITVEDAKVSKPTNKVAEARQRSITRNKDKHKT